MAHQHVDWLPGDCLMVSSEGEHIVTCSPKESQGQGCVSESCTVWSGTVPSALPLFLCQGADRMVSSLGGSQAGHCLESIVILDPTLLARFWIVFCHQALSCYMVHGQN